MLRGRETVWNSESESERWNGEVGKMLWRRIRIRCRSITSKEQQQINWMAALHLNNTSSSLPRSFIAVLVRLGKLYGQTTQSVSLRRLLAAPSFGFHMDSVLWSPMWTKNIYLAQCVHSNSPHYERQRNGHCIIGRWFIADDQVAFSSVAQKVNANAFIKPTLPIKTKGTRDLKYRAH